MATLMILGPDRNYQRISTDLEIIRQKCSESHITLDSKKFINKLAVPDLIPAGKCTLYGGSMLFKIPGRKNSLPDDIADFFEQIRHYGHEHHADYALVQDFNFDSGRMKVELSAFVQLLLEEQS